MKMKVVRPEPIAASAIATSGAASSRNDTDGEQARQARTHHRGNEIVQANREKPADENAGTHDQDEKLQHALESLFQKARDRQHR